MLYYIRNRTKGGAISCLIGNFKHLSKAAENHSKQMFKIKNIPVLSRHVVIFHEIGEEHLLFHELQARLQMSKSTLSDAISKYEELGLFEKFICPDDKRNVYVALTNSGREILKELIIIDQSFKDQIYVGITKKERKEIELYIEKMVENIKWFSI